MFAPARGLILRNDHADASVQSWNFTVLRRVSVSGAITSPEGYHFREAHVRPLGGGREEGGREEGRRGRRKVSVNPLCVARSGTGIGPRLSDFTEMSALDNARVSGRCLSWLTLRLDRCFALDNGPISICEPFLNLWSTGAESMVPGCSVRWQACDSLQIET